MLVDLIRDVRVVDWDRLGLELGVNDTDLQTIAKDNIGDSDKALRETFRKWLRCTSKPTWLDVEQALLRMGEGRVASIVREIYLTT